jgi:hypothetical protein
MADMGVGEAMLLSTIVSTGVAMATAPDPTSIKLPDPQKAIAPPQAATTPNLQAIQQGVQGRGQAGGAAGIAQTMLTGAGGVNPNKLDLNRTTLLGA